MSITTDYKKNKEHILGTRYAEAYKQYVFQTWYNNGKPSIPKLRDMIEPDVTINQKASVRILQDWLIDFRTQALQWDQEFSNRLMADSLGTKHEMFDRLADAGKVLVDAGLTFLENHTIQDEASAIRAIAVGAKIERENRGLGITMKKLSEMDDEKLTSELKLLLESTKSEVQDIIDASEITDE